MTENADAFGLAVQAGDAASRGVGALGEVAVAYEGSASASAW